MAKAIGYVDEYDAGYHGYLSMLNLSTAVRIERNSTKTSATQPDYLVIAGETETEIGAAWLRKSQTSGKHYISLTLADPQIGPRKVFANLAPVSGEIGRYVILWNPT